MNEQGEAALKYRIKERLGSMSFERSVEVRKEICREAAISPQRLSQIINAVLGSPTSAQPLQLEIIAEQLGCQVDELMNN
jgi:hypothetical protein